MSCDAYIKEGSGYLVLRHDIKDMGVEASGFPYDGSSRFKDDP